MADLYHARKRPNSEFAQTLRQIIEHLPKAYLPEVLSAGQPVPQQKINEQVALTMAQIERDRSQRKQQALEELKKVEREIAQRRKRDLDVEILKKRFEQELRAKALARAKADGPEEQSVDPNAPSAKCE